LIQELNNVLLRDKGIGHLTVTTGSVYLELKLIVTLTTDLSIDTTLDHRESPRSCWYLSHRLRYTQLLVGGLGTHKGIDTTLLLSVIHTASVQSLSGDCEYSP
jgi:hypothetical protein